MKKVLMSAVGGYQKYISPMFPPTCRYYPSCSHYTMQALEKHGAAKGAVMGVARIIRCNPFVPGGIDKVPDYFTVRRNTENAHNLGAVPKAQLSEEEQKEVDDEINYLYHEYQDEIVIHEERLTASQVLESLVDVERMDLNLMPQDYLERVKYTILSLSEGTIDSENQINLKLYKVIQNEKAKDYFQDLDSGKVNELLEDSTSSYILLEETYGPYYSTSPELGVDVQLQKGVTQGDIDNRTTNFIDYLYLLDTIYE